MGEDAGIDLAPVITVKHRGSNGPELRFPRPAGSCRGLNPDSDAAPAGVRGARLLAPRVISGDGPRSCVRETRLTRNGYPRRKARFSRASWRWPPKRKGRNRE